MGIYSHNSLMSNALAVKQGSGETASRLLGTLVGRRARQRTGDVRFDLFSACDVC